MSVTSPSLATRAIHHGYDALDHQGALNPPVFLSSTFTFDTVETGAAMFAGAAVGHFYSRVSNPTLEVLEARIASLECAGLCAASGMGAITATLWTFLEAGDEVIMDMTLYGCSFAFLTHGLPRFGVTARPVDLSGPANLAAAIGPKTRIIYLETPANPNNRLVDIAAISDIAHRHGAKVVVDNTYSTPVLTRPIEHGADIVLHSATKYLSGHGDVIAGLVAGRAEDITRIRLVGIKDMTGAVMSPLTAMLLLRGLKTLDLRMRAHSAAALTIARALEAHPAVKCVHYPGLDNFPQAGLARRQMAAFGGMIPFEVVGGKAGGIAMMNRLRLIQRAVSLGDAESLIQHPASMTHATYSPEERAAHGIAEGLVRLSVGLEGAEDILDDLMQALAAHNAAGFERDEQQIA